VRRAGARARPIAGTTVSVSGLLEVSEVALQQDKPGDPAVTQDIAGWLNGPQDPRLGAPGFVGP
jgi:hypothetical protein